LGTTILGNPHIKKKQKWPTFWLGAVRAGRRHYEPTAPGRKQHGAAPQPHEEDTREGAYHVLERNVLGYTGLPQKNNREYIRNHQSLSVAATHWMMLNLK